MAFLDSFLRGGFYIGIGGFIGEFGIVVRAGVGDM